MINLFSLVGAVGLACLSGAQSLQPKRAYTDSGNETYSVVSTEYGNSISYVSGNYSNTDITLNYSMPEPAQDWPTTPNGTILLSGVTLFKENEIVYSPVYSYIVNLSGSNGWLFNTDTFTYINNSTNYYLGALDLFIITYVVGSNSGYYYQAHIRMFFVGNLSAGSDFQADYSLGIYNSYLEQCPVNPGIFYYTQYNELTRWLGLTYYTNQSVDYADFGIQTIYTDNTNTRYRIRGANILFLNQCYISMTFQPSSYLYVAQSLVPYGNLSTYFSYIGATEMSVVFICDYSRMTSASNTAYNNGYYAGLEKGEEIGKSNAEAQYGNYYQQGYEAGYAEAYTQDSVALTIFAGIVNIALLPVNFFLACLNFEVFGINIGAFVSALLTIAVVVIIIRTITGKKND